MDVLAKTGRRIADVLHKIPGAYEVKLEETGGLPVLSVDIDREETAQYGRNIADVQLALATATRGPSGTASYVLLGEVAALVFAPSPNQISCENGKRRIVVSANVRGARRRQLRAGGAGGDRRLGPDPGRLVVPLAPFLMLTLLFVMFGNLKDGLLVFTGIRFALTGGIVALSLRGIALKSAAIVMAGSASTQLRTFTGGSEA